MVKLLLKLESLLFFLLSLVFYRFITKDWLLFILLLFMPDLSMVGYLVNKQVGAILYNIVHNYLLAVFLVILGFNLPNNVLLILGIVLFAHISMDRVLGFGLKYSSDFKHTHLEEIK